MRNNNHRRRVEDFRWAASRDLFATGLKRAEMKLPFFCCDSGRRGTKNSRQTNAIAEAVGFVRFFNDASENCSGQYLCIRDFLVDVEYFYLYQIYI